MHPIFIILLVILGIIVGISFWYIISAMCVNTKKEYTKDSKYYRFILNIATAGAMKVIRIKIHTNGLEKIPKDSRYLLVCNHRSKFDPIITWHIINKDNLAFISKPENFNVPIFGKIIRKCCFRPIDRENPRNAMKTIISASELIKNDAASVAVYPEGTRSKDCTLLPFHSGVMKIAQRSGVPIVVTTMTGAEMIHKNYPKRKSDVYFNVIDVISADKAKAMRTSVLSDEIRNKMIENLSK